MPALSIGRSWVNQTQTSIKNIYAQTNTHKFMQHYQTNTHKCMQQIQIHTNICNITKRTNVKWWNDEQTLRLVLQNAKQKSYCAHKTIFVPWFYSWNYSLIQIRTHWTLFNCSKFLSKFLNSPILGWGRPNLMQGKSQRLLNVSKV